MKIKFDILHNFISPVTGRILADYNYVLVGHRQGIATPSPALIDLFEREASRSLNGYFPPSPVLKEELVFL